MKNLSLTLCLCTLLTSGAAWADNTAVEEALRSRPDLSTFYQAMLNTGVNHELEPGRIYTVFAPTNEALARIRQDQYPCFYMVECRPEVAQIIRNHIVPGEVYVSDAIKTKGGIYSINRRFVTLGEPSRNNYAVDGNKVIYGSWVGGGMLYKINGVIANPTELAALQFADYAAVPPQTVTTTTERTIVDPACGAGGCPDSVTQTTTITRTAPAPVVSYYDYRYGTPRY